MDADDRAAPHVLDPRTAPREDVLVWLNSDALGKHKPSWADIRTVLERWPADPELATRAAKARLRVAARRPRDESALHEGAAHQALAVIDQAMVSCDDPDPRWPGLRALALARMPTNRDEEASEAFRLGLEAQPGDAALRLEHARFHAWRGRLSEAFEVVKTDSGRQALTLAAAYATGLGLGGEAARRWRELGLDATVHPRSDMPAVADMPDAQVRVPARGVAPLGLSPIPEGSAAFEVLSVAALSPAHGVVQSASLLDTVVDYGDVILWEPMPVAVTGSADARIPCFPLLEILRRGEEARLRILAIARSAEALHRLDAALRGSGRLVWHLDQASASGQQIALGKVLLPPQAALSDIKAALDSLRDESLAFSCPALYERTASSERAGKEHKAWAALERKAERLLASSPRNQTPAS